MDWKLVTFIVCSFGFFKDLRPSEAYLTPYLTGHWKNLTMTEVDNEIYPWWTYANLIWLVPMFLITDYLRYKPVLMMVGIAYIITWAILIWAQGVPAMKGMQVTFGLGTACEIGYYSYLFAVVSKDRFNVVASFSRAASLIGKFVAYLLSQLFLSYELLNYFQLNIFSFVSVCIAFLITFFLPRARFSELFHSFHMNYNENQIEKTGHLPDKSNTVNGGNVSPKPTKSARDFLMFLWTELKTIYSDKTIVIWSIWWAFASCGSFQVGNYVQNLWKKIAPATKSRNTYNGAVYAAGTLCGSITVLLVGYVPVDWSVRGRAEGLMAAVCAVNAAFLIIMGRTHEIWVAYVLYDVFMATYQVVITIASAQIARALTRQRFGFVFGCNTFIALLIETVLTAIVVDESGLGVDIRTQFVVYGCYFVVMASVFGVVFVFRLCRYWQHFKTDQFTTGIENMIYVEQTVNTCEKETVLGENLKH